MNIRRRIWFVITISTLFVSISVMLVIYFYSKKMTTREAEHILLENTQRLGVEFESAFSTLQHSSRMLEGILKANFRPSELAFNEEALNSFKSEMEPLFDSILQSIRPFSLWWVMNPELSDGEHSLSYWDDTGKGNYQREEEYSINDYDLTTHEMKWWVKAIEYGEYWTNPYFWENWNKELISFSKAIYSDGVLIGVAGSDFYFNDLREKTSEISIFETGYVFLMDSSFNLIIHPYEEGRNLKDILPVKQVVNINQQFKNSRNGIVRYTYRNEKKLAGFSRLSNGWIICAAPTEKEVYKSIKEMTMILLLLFISALFVAWLIATIFGNRLTKPLYDLMGNLRKGSEGDLTDRAIVKSDDEIGELAQHYNSFMQNQEDLINDLKEAEEQLIEAKIKAEEANELKTALLRNISHEVRTPLNSISGFSNLMSQRNIDDEKRDEYINIINKNVSQLVEIVSNLLEVSRMEAEDLILNKRDFDLIRVMNRIYKLHHENVIRKNLAFKKNIHGQSLMISSDPYRLKQLFDNLLSNAIKFTDEGYIEIGLEEKGNSIRLYVKDSGVGIHEELQAELFEVFKRGSDSPELTGIGTGLAICKQIVQKMGGEIWFEPNKPNGAIFFIEIPID